MSHQFRRRPVPENPGPGSPSKRWSTTSGEYAETAKLMHYDRGQQVRDLVTRKLANTKTSISFGNEKVVYISDTMENQTKASAVTTAEERALQAQRIKQMKADLTTTNFSLGNETPLYASVNQDAMRNGEKYYGVPRVSMNDELKAAVKKSSLHFGNESVVYETVNQESFKNRGNENDFSKLKEEVQEQTARLRRHNFSFGNEETPYETDYQRGYGPVKMEAYKIDNRKEKMKGIIQDSRSCHFSLGNDRITYKSNTHSALDTILGHAPADVAAQADRAKEMKAALQKTSIVIGDNSEYM